MLRENKVLTILGLQFCELDPKGLCEVFSAVEMNTTLTSLDLSENTIDDQSITSLGKYAHAISGDHTTYSNISMQQCNTT